MACSMNCWNATTAWPTCAPPRWPRLATRFTVDTAQAKRVGETAAALYRAALPRRRAAAASSRAGRALAQAGLGGAVARDRHADLAQRLSQARRLHPRQHRRARLRGERDARASASWCWASAASCASSRPRWTTRPSSMQLLSLAPGGDPVPRAPRPGSAGAARCERRGARAFTIVLLPRTGPRRSRNRRTSCARKCWPGRRSAVGASSSAAAEPAAPLVS